MKKLLKVLSLVILLFTVSPILLTVAYPALLYPPGGSLDNDEPGQVVPNADTGFHGTYAYRIGLSQCVNEEVTYSPSGGENAKAVAVQQYAAKYYTPILGPSAYYVFEGSGSATVDYQGLPCTQVSSTALTDILSSVANGTEGTFVKKANGYYIIPPDEEIVSTVMEELKALGGRNTTLYNHWLEEQKSLDAAKHPVVICVEIVGEVVNDGRDNYWLGSADLAARISGSSARSRLVSSDLTGYNNGNLSTTCNAIASICGFQQGTSDWDNWPYRATKRLFSAKFDRVGGHKGSGEWYGNVAANAWQTYSSGGQYTGINGVTVVAVGTGEADISGSYTWHINASRLPINSEGYREDNSADSEGDKIIGIGAVDLKQDNQPAWREWISTHPGTFEIKMEKYYRGGETFSVQWDEVIGSRSEGGQLSSAKDETSTYVSADQLWNYVVNGSDLNINGMSGGGTDSLGGTPIGEDRYQVAYATKVTIIASNGESVELFNEDVHYAIYGSDNDRTYKYNQMLSPGYSQVKQGDGGLDTEEFEAMSGTPTTKDLFITQGGEQFIVKLQFRYVDESYARTYTLREQSAYPNFMYYWTTGSSGNSDETGRSNNEFNVTHSSHNWIPESEYGTANINMYESMCSELKAYVSAFEVDNNYGAAEDYETYRICAPDKVDNLTEMKHWVDDIPDSGTSASYSREFILADARDLDSSKDSEVKVTVSFTGGLDLTQYTDGWHEHNGCGVDSNGNHTCGYPDNKFNHHDSYSVAYQWSVTVDYGDFSPDIKDLTYENTLTQTYDHVRYLDIVEARLFRLEGGKQVGLGYILADTDSEKILEMACEQMGYCLYDSEQTHNTREWDTEKRMWTAIAVDDLETTGRVLNSYWKGTVPITLPDGSSITWVSDKDQVVISYDIAQGGRSHHARDAYFARVAGNMFYQDNTGNNPYRNTMFISSDVMGINTGDTSSNGYEAFCYNDVDTTVVSTLPGLEQYIMDREVNTWTKYRNKTFKKNDHSSEVLNCDAPAFQESAYLDGIVDLNKLDSSGAYATKYNKTWICEDNPYTFVNKIPESGGITWVGYKGDYQTTTASHAPELRCVSDFNPSMSKAVSQELFADKTFAFDLVTLNEDTASPSGAFPHLEGLNVIRWQDNNLYATGYANVCYDLTEDVDHTAWSGVLPLEPSYRGANVNVQSNKLYVSSPDCSIRAIYASGWETPNDIVIFNPSTAENAWVYKQSTYMPDLSDNGGEDSSYPVRDQRASGYYIGLTNANGVFVGDDSLDTSTGYVPTKEIKKLKDKSTMYTTYYSDEDYNIIEGSGEASAMMTTNSTFRAPFDATYQFTVFDATNSSTSVLVRLDKGDVVNTVDGTLYKEAKPDVVTFSDYINSDNVVNNVDNPYKTSPSRVDSFVLNALSDVEAGDVIHLRYTFEDNFDKSNAPFDVNVVVDDSTAVADKLITTVDGHTWDYYIEFKKDCVVDRINVSFNVNTKLVALSNSEYVLEFVDMFIMSAGNAYSSPANKSTTIDFVYLNNYSCAYNINFVDYTILQSNPEDIVPYRVYIDYAKTDIMYSLKAESANNPHIVYNRNWKYYVVGWKTINGNTITSPTDPLLNLDDTVLMWPSGLGEISVGDLKEQACLVMYNGSLYVTTKMAGLEHKILEKGYVVTSYDTFTLGDPAQPLSVETVDSPTETTYPLRPGQSGRVFQEHKYEFFFALSYGSGSDGYLYDVQYSKNPYYRFASNDVSNYFGKERWTVDWDVYEVSTGCDIYGITQKNYDTDATFLSLDDKFSIHYDNYGNYHETDWHNAGSTNVDLGFGFVDNMDTITWIRDKYVRFAFDVYVYGYNTTYNCPDPSVTYEEYVSGEIVSSLHNGSVSLGLHYVPAGTPILLGYYDENYDEADNSCRFTDFGSKCGYDYNFWVVLSSDETELAENTFVSSNINNNGTTEDNRTDNNKDAPSAIYARYANAMRVDPISIVGRIGNLTMLDTGDYRFSDTFKTTAEDANWLVFGLIKRLSAYSNTYGVPSTQKALLLDPWDVRGRLGIPELSDFTEYTGYPNSGYSTYNTQWHKVGDKTRIESLPLSSSFNEHDALKLTQMRIGYANLLTLDSIGNYYGSSTQYSYDPETEPVNHNGDYGNMKVQIRPYYIAVDVSDPDNVTAEPVDVYMKSTDSYVIINSGSMRSKDVLGTMYDNTYNVYLENNTEDAIDGTYKLDQNMLRRMVTSEEAAITWEVLNDWNNNVVSPSVISMLTNVRNLNDWNVENKYIYGNGQYLFLRDRNRTFIGSNSIALNYNEPDGVTSLTDYKAHAQKWYFDLGLPSSAVFVPTGVPYSKDAVISKDGVYILACVDVYAMGEVWQLHYESPVSKMSIDFAGITVPNEVWNPVKEDLPWLVPVCIYDTSGLSAKDDLSTEGTH